MYKKALFYPFRGRFTGILITLLLAGSVSAVAQLNSGTIFGTVQDSSGAVIPNAQPSPRQRLLLA